jgi:hypothetical protein
VFWPDEEILSQQGWWKESAWSGGPTLGVLIEALRPALRAALLLGWQVDSIEVGIGKATNETTEWKSIELATLELDPAKPLDVDKPFDGPNVHLGTFEIADLIGRIGEGTFAIPMDIPIIGAGGLGETIPTELLEGVDAFVNDAIDELASTVPGDPVLAAPRAIGRGLLWIFYTNYWRGLNVDAKWAADVESMALRQDPTAFLIGELWALPVTKPREEFWPELALSIQARGEANRLPQRARNRLPTMPWLDALSELIWRGAVIVDGLVEPADPCEPIEPLPTDKGQGSPVEEVTLSIWGGDAEITLRRVLTFDSEGKDTIDTSVAWDYVPGDEQQRPTVVVVAGRGVAVEFDRALVRLAGRTLVPEEATEPPETARVSEYGQGTATPEATVASMPWDLLIHRTEDDHLIHQLGAQIDPAALLDPSVIDPDPVFPVNGPFPSVLVVPKHDGVLLQFPAAGNSPTNVPVSGIDIPRVIELTIEDPAAGTDAWTADVYFYTYSWGVYTLGAAHLCVWASEGVQVRSNDSPTECGRGDPSYVVEGSWVSAWLYSGELWEADRATKLAKPFSKVLPYTEDTVARPDRLPGEPLLSYSGGHANDHGIRLTPAWHCYRQYGYIDSLAFTLFDVILGFTPFGDIADIGEAAWAWQTGRDKWGRPLTEGEVAFMIVCAAVPLVSTGLLKGIRTVLGMAIEEIPTAELGRLAVPARWANDVPLDQVEAVKAIERMTAPVDELASPGRREQAAAAILALVNDTPISEFGQRLADGRATGWPTVGDALSQGGDGFAVGPLQTAYLRFLRDHPGSVETAAQFSERLRRGG